MFAQHTKYILYSVDFKTSSLGTSVSLAHNGAAQCSSQLCPPSHLGNI